MIRYGIGILVATAACAAIGLVACGDDIKDSGGSPVTGTGGAGGGGGTGGSSGGGTVPTKCEGQCCPTDATCYSSSAGVDSPGSECMALRDNTGQDHIQMRQAWIRATTPVGNTDSIVYGVLAGRSELPSAACNQGRSPLGSGGYIQIIDFFLGGTDKSKHYSTVGYSTFVSSANLQQTLTDGFCNGVDADYSNQVDAKYALSTADITPSDLNFPPGLPKPMGVKDGGWKVGPTKAKRIDADFDLTDSAKRLALLAMFDDANPDNIKKDGFGGVFYYDDATGYAHGYGSMGWTVVYGQNGKTHLSIPIREVETRSRFNHTDHPNCVGTYRADVLTPGGNPPCGSNSATNPAWGGGNCPPDPKGGNNHSCDPAADEAPATTDGYFLITELEQLYSPDLLKTLCVSYPGTVPDPNDATAKIPAVQTQGFYDSTNASCRSATWDPKKPGGAGIPKGDWCAATNSKATDTCHDAWRSHSLHVFSAAKIKVGDATNPVATCPFQP